MESHWAWDPGEGSALEEWIGGHWHEDDIGLGLHEVT